MATKETAAIKVIKNKKAFKNQGVIEIKILDMVSRDLLTIAAEQSLRPERGQPSGQNA
jgi:hypothetical protein